MAQAITVLGGTGMSGRRVAAALRLAGHRVRVASRRGTIPFDWAEPVTWPAVIDGVEAVYLVPTAKPTVVQRFVDAAIAAGVRRLVLLSGRGLEHYVERFGAEVVAAEDAVATTGRATIVRASNFNQNFTEGVFAAPVRAGRLALPAREIAEAFVDLGDVAAVAVRALTEEHHCGCTYELTGPEPLTFERAVAIMAAAADRNVTFEVLSPDAYADELRDVGVPDARVVELKGLFAVMAEGHVGSATG